MFRAKWSQYWWHICKNISRNTAVPLHPWCSQSRLSKFYLKTRGKIRWLLHQETNTCRGRIVVPFWMKFLASKLFFFYFFFFHFMYNLFLNPALRTTPITVIMRSEAWRVFARSNTGVVGSSPNLVMDVCVCLFCVCVVMCIKASRRAAPRPRSPTDCVLE
jgi:hypothetical protein